MRADLARNRDDSAQNSNIPEMMQKKGKGKASILGKYFQHNFRHVHMEDHVQQGLV